MVASSDTVPDAAGDVARVLRLRAVLADILSSSTQQHHPTSTTESEASCSAALQLARIEDTP